MNIGLTKDLVAGTKNHPTAEEPTDRASTLIAKHTDDLFTEAAGTINLNNILGHNESTNLASSPEPDFTPQFLASSGIDQLELDTQLPMV